MYVCVIVEILLCVDLRMFLVFNLVCVSVLSLFSSGHGGVVCGMGTTKGAS